MKLFAFLLLLAVPCFAQESGRVHESGVRRLAVKRVLPEFPIASQKRHSIGVAIAVVTFNSEGEVTDAWILEAPDKHIEKAVVDAVKQWEFRPPITTRGIRMNLTGRLTFYFREEAGRYYVSHPKRYEHIK